MKRILTGIQSSGKPHLGNLLGAILPAIQLSQNKENQCFYFIADLHSLTTIKEKGAIIENTYSVAAAWLACGLDTEKHLFYRQSRVTETCELAWYLGCFTPYPMLANAHSFKDKSERLSSVNSGLFFYPVLMAADILLYDINLVPVGKDQKQHLEITRDIANSFNNAYKDSFVIPEPVIEKSMMTIPGVDGQKMSKSYNNTIDIFQPEKQLRKDIMKILTDSTPVEDPKNPDTCNVFSIYKLLANSNLVDEMKSNYLGGNYGYGSAKQQLFELILDKFSEERKQYDYFINNKIAIEQELLKGEKKAKEVANSVLLRIRKKIGYES